MKIKERHSRYRNRKHSLSTKILFKTLMEEAELTKETIKVSLKQTSLRAKSIDMIMKLIK